MNQSKHLILFTLGPVQSFIAQARKTQDLYAGSALLSDLIHFALGYTKFQGHEIIFPYYESSNLNFDIEKFEDNHSFPNRFVASLNYSTEEQDKVQAFGKTLENLVRGRFEKIAAEKFDIIPAQHRPSGLCEQIKDFLEIYWTAIPYDESKGNYKDKFKSLEQYLGAVKNVRSFRQLSETGRKCSVNGEYNVKIYRKTEEEEKHSLEKIKRSKLFAVDNYIICKDYRDISNHLIQPGEGLCAISFLKRLYRNKDSFPSTAEIALLNLWNDDKIGELIRILENTIGKNFDKELLFDDNLNEAYFNKNGIDIDQLSDVKEKQKQIFDIAKAKDLKPSKYYALLSFDGDSMGEWLSEARSKEEHRKFSKLLMDFAEKATNLLNGDKEVTYKNDKGEEIKIEKKQRGKTVYAGGDDFLGFVNLEGLFETIEKLKAVFDVEVTKKVEIKNGNKQFTMSMGVVIAHYKMPLKKVIQLNRELLHETKERFKLPLNDYTIAKNGIGFCYTTTNTILGKTYINDIEDLKILKKITNYFISNDVSQSILFKYAQSIQSITGTTLSYDAYLTQMNILSTELLRLLKRSSNANSRDLIIKDLIQNKENGILKDVGLTSLLRRQTKEHKPNEWIIDIDNFLSFLKIATKLSANYLKQIDNAVPIN
jgi:CRISPR-associated protein Cmr2